VPLCKIVLGLKDVLGKLKYPARVSVKFGYPESEKVRVTEWNTAN